MFEHERTANQAKPYRRPDVATRNHSRGTRLIGRSGGNRPRTHPTPKPRRKPVLQRPSRLRTAGDALRHAERIQTDGSCKKSGLGALTGALCGIRERLEAALSVASLCVIALKGQAADHDIDIALCLECCVEQVISDQMEHIDNVVKRAAS